MKIAERHLGTPQGKGLGRHLLPLGIILLALGIVDLAYGFLIQTYPVRRGSARQARWLNADRGVPYTIDQAGSDDLTPAETHRLLRESFAVWNDVVTAKISLVDQGLSSGRAPSQEDGINLVIFDETGRWLQAPRGTGIIAATRINTNLATGAIEDADIIFNGRDFRFGTNSQSGRVDLKDVTIHEIGHFVGLDHTPLDGPPTTRPTMNPFNRGDGPGEAQSLEPDDIAGISTLYPSQAFLRERGSISGEVKDLNGQTLFGVHVIAEDLGNGARYSTVTGALPTAPSRGHFTLQGLPAASYRLSITPIEGAITEDNFGGIFQNFTTDFPAEFYPNTPRNDLALAVTVEDGIQNSTIDFTTGFLQPGFPFVETLHEPANTPNPVGPYLVRARVIDAFSVNLLYHTGDQSIHRIPMEAVEDQVYEAAIPGQMVGTAVQYQIEAANLLSRTTLFPHNELWLEFDVVKLSGAPLAFTVFNQENSLSVFDTGTRRELARVNLGQAPIQALMTPDGSFIYVSTLGSDEIAVIETSTFQLVGRIQVASEPLDMALSPDGLTIYVTNSGAASVTAIDIATNQPRLLRLIGTNSSPYGVAATGPTIYVTDLDNDRVLGLDSAGNIMITISVADQPRSLAISPDQSRLYVTSFNSQWFTVIDVADNRARQLALPVSGTFAVAPNTDGTKVYLTAHLDGAVVVVDGKGETVIKTVEIGTNPRAISFSPEGDQAYISNASSDEITILDTKTDQIAGSYATGRGPRGIAVAPAPAIAPTSTAEPVAEPTAFGLAPNFPNPFNAETLISYTIPKGPGGASVDLRIYNLLGQTVRTLFVGSQIEGTYTLVWDGLDQGGQAVASGVYLIQLRAPGHRATQKMMLLR